MPIAGRFEYSHRVDPPAYTYKVKDENGTEDAVIKLRSLPDRCPACGNGVSPTFITIAWRPRVGQPQTRCLQWVCKCPLVDCRRVFIAHYEESVTRQLESIFFLKGLEPAAHADVSFSAEIEEVSPKFVQIYTQATLAQLQLLDEVAGVGFRKALEFLVKDFAIYEHPDDAQKIRSMFLGKVIKEYLKEDHIREAAERAAWLGNDETHYERRWQNHDIADLLALTKLTVNAIESTLVLRRYKNELVD